MSDHAAAVEHTTVRPNAYVAKIDLYGTYEQVEAACQEHLRGQGYYLRPDPITRNGLEVHSVYLVDKRQYVRMASMFFDAWNHCRFCGSWDVSTYEGLTGTTVFCHNCGINRGYRGDDPAGYDQVNPALPTYYKLGLNPRDITPQPVIDMALHPSTFEYLAPTEQQIATMAEARQKFASLAADLDRLLPDGADKTYVLRKLRECAMWSIVAATREADGSPRTTEQS